MTRRTGRGGLVLVGVLVTLALAAPVLSPNDPRVQHADLANAPPMRPRIVDDSGQLRRPFIYPLAVSDRLAKRFDTVRTPVPIRLFADGRLATTGSATPWLLLGGDPLGRDVFARLAYGARLSLSLAATATLLALLVGGAAGAIAGYAGGRTDRAIMAIADVVVILPAAYVVVTFRAAMSLVLEPAQVFWTIVVVLAAASWPLPARGVRAIIAAERSLPYAEAAYAAGAGPWRILRRHLLPASYGHLATQGFLLFPAFILAEATLSFLGLGFADPVASWGVMLYDAGTASAIVETPWLMAPAGAIVLAVLATHFVTAGRSEREPAVRL